jgi:ABC-type nickel/cobalt efflux system permease component RcnA
MRSATLVVEAGSGGALPAEAAAGEIEANRTSEGRFARFVHIEDLSPAVVALSLLAAFAWGAAHALTPGHGKAVVAAYLVGTRGTARHAAFLAGTVTVTHTAGVFVLALITLWLSNFVVPERLYPWLTVVSGVLVLAIGLTLLVHRLRAWRAAPLKTDRIEPAEHARMHVDGTVHSHDGFGHAHAIPGADGSRVTPHSLLALGVSGGLVPCPSALILLLGAIAAGNVAYGMVMVLAFSTGLAAVLLLIGVLVVYARWVVRRFSFEPRVPRLLPALSAAAISVAGVLLLADSLTLVGVR